MTIKGISKETMVRRRYEHSKRNSALEKPKGVCGFVLCASFLQAPGRVKVDEKKDLGKVETSC